MGDEFTRDEMGATKSLTFTKWDELGNRTKIATKRKRQNAKTSR